MDGDCMKEHKIHKPRMSKKERWLKRFGAWYYPVQYLIVRTLYFGLVVSPDIEQFYYAFRVGGIINTALSFYQYIPAVFSIGHVIELIPIFSVYAARILWACRYAVIYAFAFLSLLRYLFLRLVSFIDALTITMDKQVVIHNGAPGSGKTWMLVMVGYALSRLMWRKLSYIRWRDKNKWEMAKGKGQIRTRDKKLQITMYKLQMRSGTAAQHDVQKQSDWRETEDAYKYYTTPQTVIKDGVERTIYPAPCLFSNIGVYAHGRMSSKLKFEHAAQLQRLPAYTVSLFSEFGTTFSQEYSFDKYLPMSDDLRQCRQFRENIIMGDEQESTNIAIDARRVVSDVLLMTQCKRVMKPLLLLAVFKPLQLFFGKTQRFGKVFSGFMTLLEALINATGFVRFKYEHEGSDLHSRQGRRKRNSLMFPMTPYLRYDTRAFRNLYDCKEQPLSCHVHTALAIENTPENRQAYLRAEYDNRPRPGCTEHDKFDGEYEAARFEEKFYELGAMKAGNRKTRERYPAEAAEFKRRFGITDDPLPEAVDGGNPPDDGNPSDDDGPS